MEIESPPIKTDLVRMTDEYGRAGLLTRVSIIWF